MGEAVAVAKEKALSFSEQLTIAMNEQNDAIPADMNRARFAQNCVALLNEHPELTKYNPAMLKAGLLKGAYLGLDFYSKECYLVPFGNQLQFSIDYRGAKKLCKRFSIRPVKDIGAQVVREGDDFQMDVVDGQTTFTFKPKPFNNGNIIGAFAFVIYADGGVSVEQMSKAEIDVTRGKSRAKNAMAWTDFYSEMAKKTVIHRLCKHIELDMNARQRELWGDDMPIDTEKKAQPVDNPFGDVVDAEEEVVDGSDQ